MPGPRISIPKFLAKLRENLDFVGSYDPVLGDVVTPVFQVDEAISGSQPRYLTDADGADLTVRNGGLGVTVLNPSSGGSTVLGPEGAHEIVMTPHFINSTRSQGVIAQTDGFVVPEGGRWYWFGDSLMEVTNDFLYRSANSNADAVFSIGVSMIYPSPPNATTSRVAFHTYTERAQNSNNSRRGWNGYPDTYTSNKVNVWALPTMARSSIPTFVPAGEHLYRMGWSVGGNVGAAGAGVLLTIPFASAAS